MDLQNYIPAIVFANENRDISIKLGQLANNIFNNLPLPEINDAWLLVAKNDEILKATDEIQYATSYSFQFFYALNFVESHKYSLLKESDWIVFFDSLYLPLYGQVRKIVGYNLIGLVVLIADRIYGIKISKIVLENNSTPFAVKRTFCSIFPYFSDTLEQIIDALFVVTEGFKVDDNYLDLNKSVSEYSETNIEFGKQILQKSKISTIRLHLFSPFAFRGLTRSTGIIETFPLLEDLFLSSNSEQNKAALRCLAMLHGDDDTPQDAEDKIKPFLDEIEAKKDDSLTPDLIYVYGLLINKFSIARSKLEFLSRTLPGENSYFALSGIVFRKIEEEIDQDWLKNSLQVLSNLKSQHVGTYKNVSSALTQIIGNYPERVFDYIESFIAENDNELRNIEGFETVFRSLGNTNLPLLQRWITIWFNRDDDRFHIALRNILSSLMVGKISNIKLDADLLNTLSPADVQYIAIKIADYVYSREQLESLLYSVLSYNGESLLVEPLMVDLLYNYLICNYANSIKYIQKQEKKTPIEIRVVSSIEELVNKRPKIKTEKPSELCPSQERMQQLFLQKTKTISDEMRRSPFVEPSLLDIISKVSIKTGKYIFSRDSANYGNRNRYSSKTPMRHFSESTEMPNREFIDPVGQAFSRYRWTTFKRKTQ